jgi:hypothetical protein
MLKEVNSGQEVTLSATALSNTVIPLRDILVKVEYPLGFNYIDADPPPSFGNNIWRIGTMAPTGKFNVKIRGTLAGEDTQEKVFHTAIGVGADQASRAIDISYGSVLSSVILQRPFIGISLSMNGKLADQAVARFGQRIGGVVNWSNNLNTKIVNAQIEVHLSGVALDRKTVIAADGGFFRSTDNTIFWDERAEKHLSEIEAGGSGSVSFSFLPVPSVTNNTLLTSPIITAEVTVRGKRISEAGVPEEIKTEFTQEVKITSEAQIAARLVHYVGPFVNTGPMPPKVEQETSYTVIWDIMNTSNSIKNAVVHAGIPSFVTWAGSIFPSNENIVYDPATNQITWSPGDIPAGTGVTSAPREVAFQLIFTPGLTQVGQVPALINKIHFDGVDTFTGAALSQDKGELTTSLSTDPKALPSTASVAP